MNIIQEWLFQSLMPKVEPGFDAHGVHFDALPVPWGTWGLRSSGFNCYGMDSSRWLLKIPSRYMRMCIIMIYSCTI